MEPSFSDWTKNINVKHFEIAVFQSERLDILQAMSRSLLLEQDTSLPAISDMCEHFTGADFKALLYNAQLAAIHRNTSSNGLYKGVFSNTEKASKGEKIAKDPPTGVVSDEAKANIIYVRSLVEGITDVSGEELSKIHSEVGSDSCRNNESEL